MKEQSVTSIALLLFSASALTQPTPSMAGGFLPLLLESSSAETKPVYQTALEACQAVYTANQKIAAEFPGQVNLKPCTAYDSDDVTNQFRSIVTNPAQARLIETDFQPVGQLAVNPALASVMGDNCMTAKLIVQEGGATQARPKLQDVTNSFSGEIDAQKLESFIVAPSPVICANNPNTNVWRVAIPVRSHGLN